MDFRLLKGMAVLASKDETRYVLCGVCLDVGKKTTRLIATDGRKLGVYKVEGDGVQHDLQPNTQVILPVPNFARLGCEGKKHRLICAEWDPEERPEKRRSVTWSSTSGFSQRMDYINGTFPAIDGVIPKQTAKAGYLAVNLDYLSSFLEASRVLWGNSKGNSVRVVPTAADNDKVEYAPYSVFTECPYFYGVLMPMRWDGEYSAPEWAKSEPAEEPAPAVQPEAQPEQPAQ